VQRMMSGLRQSGAFTLPEATLASIRSAFKAGRASEAEVAMAIRTVKAKSGYVLDPHTATGIVAANKSGLDPAVPVVMLATAAPAKFPDAMRAIDGIEAPLPPRLAHLMTDQERMSPVANDADALEGFIRAHVAKAG
jgi:threonine synthase